MAEIDHVLGELRHRIMRSFENPPPARQRHETNEEGPAMTQPSAAIALRRLAHPGRDGVVLDSQAASEPINPGRDGGVVVADGPISPLIRRLSLDMPELIEEVVAFIGRRTAELNERDGGAAPRTTQNVPPTALVGASLGPQDDDTGTATINLRFDTEMLARIDASAKRQGISRRAWLHIAASRLLEERR